MQSRGVQQIKVQELEIKRKVIALRIQKKQCSLCGYFKMAKLPQEFQGSSFGPELHEIRHYGKFLSSTKENQQIPYQRTLEKCIAKV